MATQVQRPSVNGATPRKPSTPRATQKPSGSSVSKPGAKGAAGTARQKAAPVANKAYSIAGENAGSGVTSAYAIMASRIANRVADLAENITFSERPKAKEQENEMQSSEEKKRPRKLEMRFGASGSGEQVSFSAPFLDNTLQKMLLLQNRMLMTSAEISKASGVGEKIIKEHAAQSAELSRIIAMICAEKARQGA